MNNFFRALIAGYGAKKLGGGCFSTVLIFIVIWYALGHCNNSRAAVAPKPTIHSAEIKNVSPQPVKADVAVFVKN